MPSDSEIQDLQRFKHRIGKSTPTPKSSRWCKLEFKVGKKGRGSSRSYPEASRASERSLSLSRRVLSEFTRMQIEFTFPWSQIWFCIRKWWKNAGVGFSRDGCTCVSFWMTCLMKNSQRRRGTTAGPSEWRISQKNRLGRHSRLLEKTSEASWLSKQEHWVNDGASRWPRSTSHRGRNPHPLCDLIVTAERSLLWMQQ